MPNYLVIETEQDFLPRRAGQLVTAKSVDEAVAVIIAAQSFSEQTLFLVFDVSAGVPVKCPQRRALTVKSSDDTVLSEFTAVELDTLVADRKAAEDAAKDAEAAAALAEAEAFGLGQSPADLGKP